MNEIVDYGRGTAFSCVNARDLSPLKAFVSDAAAGKDAGKQALFGAVAFLAQVLNEAKKSDLVTFDAPVTPGQLDYALQTNEAKYYELAGRVFDDMGFLLRACPGLNIATKSDVPLASVEAALPPTGPLKVEVVSMPLDVAISARIVEMPVRQTTTTIERDSNGNIIGSTQVEGALLP